MILGFLKTFMVNGKTKNTNFVEKINKGIKLHTIRTDEKKRWRPEMKIHYATGVRSQYYDNWRMGKCTGVQPIEIRDRSVWVNGRELNESEIIYLSDNDGFDCVEDFWGWFDLYSPFEGRLIHWTDLRY